MSHDWDAACYHAVSDPQFAWGLTVLERLSLEGDETVLDAGCGTGRLTACLLDRLPRGRVIAVDSSPAMVARARLHLAAYAGRLEVIQADLGTLSLAAPVDAIFSTATFHWIHDHAGLFARLHATLVAGGRLEAQCGGGPNLARVRARAKRRAAEPRFAPLFRDWRDPWEYADEATTARRLAAAGFASVRTWLEEAPTRFAGPSEYRAFLAGVVIRPYLACLPDDEKAAFVDPLIARASADQPPWTLDYWRLNMSAVRPA